MSNRFRTVAFVMGTAVDFDMRSGNLSPDELGQLVGVAIERLHSIDEAFSTYKEGSQISRLGRGEISIDECSEDVRTVLDLCEKLHQATSGYFDIYLAAGYPPASELQHPASVPGARPLEPSGVVKGWAIQEVVDLFRRSGVYEFCINGGGDVFVSGAPEGEDGWRVGLQHPSEKMKVMAVLEVRDVAIATSGLYERGQHIVSPTAGANELVSLTVVGADMILTDAYATAAFAMGLAGMDWVERQPGFDVYAVDNQGVVHRSAKMSEYLL